MINVLLDDLPKDWNGHKINTSFRVGIQIQLCIEDADLSNEEKTACILSLLFQETFPTDPEEIKECVKWFLGGWNHDNESTRKHSKSMDFDIDQWRIYAEFYAKYKIDLAKEDMHYWRFMGMLSCLDGAYANVIGIRQKEIDPKMNAKDKAIIMDAKHVYSLTTEAEKEEQKAINDFLGGNIDWSKEKKYIKEFESYAEVNKGAMTEA